LGGLPNSTEWKNIFAAGIYLMKKEELQPILPPHHARGVVRGLYKLVEMGHASGVQMNIT
jgi:hypothetical protein